jgi:hypothetical protein
MRQGMSIRATVSLILLGTLLACGGDTTTAPKTPTLSKAEAQQVATGIFSEVSKALLNTGVSTPTAAAARSIAAAATPSFSSPCTNGGSISGSYSFTDGLNAQGTGTVSGSITVTSNGCEVSTGTRTVNVGGSFQFTYSMAFTQFVQSGNSMFHGAGTFTWDGNSCPMDYTVTLTPQGKATVSGTVCGQSVDGTA